MKSVGADRLMAALRARGRGFESEYLHWDKLRHLDPPEGLTSEEWWLAVKMSRAPLLRSFPLTDPDGSEFGFALPDEVLRLLHFVDQRCSGEIAMTEVVTADDQARQHYLVNSLMEEAIRSSQLEGAQTSRRVAKDMLASGREPKDRSERMIANNYRALQFIREDIGESLTPAAVLELQRILTEGTLDNPDAAGRLQTPDDERVAVYDVTDGSLMHRPPPADQLPERLRLMCQFANEGGVDDETFVHPVVRSILLHFWLAYDHPFEDGNGRTARALFYWSMRKHGYWLTEYLSISRILRQGPAKYAKAFMLTETDERDTTYFIIFQLSVIRRAVNQLHTYLARKIREVRQVEEALKGADNLNHRQLALISDAIRNPEQVYTFRSHAGTHNVTEETARTDLLQLSRRRLLTRRTAGRRHTFQVPPDLAGRLTGEDGKGITLRARR
jgi:Fic family protein